MQVDWEKAARKKGEAVNQPSPVSCASGADTGEMDNPGVSPAGNVSVEVEGRDAYACVLGCCTQTAHRPGPIHKVPR